MIRDILNDYRLPVPTSLGKHRCACPECSDQNTHTHNRRVIVIINAHEVAFRCYRCGYAGREELYHMEHTC